MIIRHKHLHTAGLALTVALLVATAAAANASDYEFRITKAPNPGAAPTIELIDAATGRVVPGAEIDVVQTATRLQQKGVPNVQRTFIPIKTYLDRQQAQSKSELPANGKLTLMATVPGEFWPVWRNVDFHN